jgi:ABC-type spermidine/putrescine transport system permease subunit I
MILFLLPILIFLLAFFVLPFGVMLYESFFLSPLIAPEAPGPTLANYTKLFGDLFYLKIVLQTLALGAAVTLLMCSRARDRGSS